MSRRAELFAEADVGGVPWEREECRLIGSRRARNTRAWEWGGLAQPPAGQAVFSLGWIPHPTRRGWDLCCMGRPRAGQLVGERMSLPGP